MRKLFRARVFPVNASKLGGLRGSRSALRRRHRRRDGDHLRPRFFGPSVDDDPRLNVESTAHIGLRGDAEFRPEDRAGGVATAVHCSSSRAVIVAASAGRPRCTRLARSIFVPKKEARGAASAA